MRADVGAAVAADLRLVVDAAERHAHELAVQRAGDRLADRRLAGPGRADQRQDRAGALVLLDAALLAQLAHGEVLDDALLDVLEPGVVGVEHLARVRRVEALLGALAPRHGEQPVEVRADHLRLAALVAHALEPGDLALGLLAHGVRACRPRRSSCGSPRRPSRRPRRAPCGSTPSGGAGCTRAAASARRTRRPRGCGGAPAARRAARAAGAATAPAARRRRRSRAARPSRRSRCRVRRPTCRRARRRS